jgi:hypothetical protein
VLSGVHLTRSDGAMACTRRASMAGEARTSEVLRFMSCVCWTGEPMLTADGATSFVISSTFSHAFGLANNHEGVGGPRKRFPLGRGSCFHACP